MARRKQTAEQDTGAYADYSAAYPEKRGSHWIRVTILALIPILIVAGGGTYLLTRHTKPDTRQADSEAALRSYLTDWAKADYAGMASHADVSAATIKAIDAPIRHNLVISVERFTPGPVVRDTKTGDTATASYSAQLTVAGLGRWDYPGSLSLTKTKAPKGSKQSDIWRVHFTPAAIQPRLTTGTTLMRTHVTATRGRLLDADGIPLRGQDGELDSNLLGTVGPLTAAQAKAAGPQFTTGDVAGQTGIERVYNTQLTGNPGGTIYLVKGATRLASLFDFPATPGRDVKTTIDLRIQRAGEAALAAESLPAALVSIDTKTGAVTSIVNTPAGGFGRALRGQYPPGSTFKVITATAALLAGKTEATPLDCPAIKLVSGRPFKNANNEAFGLINLRTAFAQSCNTAFINLRQSITEADMKRAALLYGFDETQPLPITSYGGSYPVPSGPVDEAASAFGQAAVLASPLQMATVAAAVASGSWRKPFLVGATTVTHPIPANVDAALKDMMRAVVTEGTAAPSVVTFPGLVYGKTGTAEEGSTAQNLPTDAWFIGWRNTTAFAVIVPGGGFGASVAAPIASRFLTNLGPS
jgi:hypothetical protein